MEERDPTQACRLLRVRSEWPRNRRAVEQGDELATFS
jgi:hypothetical protein